MAGSTNFLQWNANQTNQLSDTAYSSDASRTGGAGVGAVFPSATANKLFYQLSTFATAFARMLTAKNFSPSDSDVNALQGVLSNVITTADINAKLTVVSYASSVVFNASHSDGFELTLQGNVVSSTFSGGVAGQEITFVLVQDSIGGRSIAWPAGFSGMGTPDPTANAVSIQKIKIRSDGSVHAMGPMTVS